ncbi:MAG: hypothetical protein JJT88_08745 [Gammaproteobacteria bacterium]|nr:hypothetical protein [Gammaproteobacteria bacterium]
MEVDDAVQAVKLRYLNAIGIESWVRRSSPAADTGASGAGGSAVVAESASDPASDPEETVVEMLTDEPVAAVRSLLDAKPGAEPVAVPPPAPEAQPAPVAAADEAPTAVTPEFRLEVLHLAGSVLLVDDSLLDPGALRSEQLLLLADLLRCAHLMAHGDATGSIERQVFYWPQVEDAALDQGMPRAREALAYHVRMRLEGGSGPVLHVARSDGAVAGCGSTIARDSIASVGARVLEITAELLDPQASGQGSGKLRAQIWAELGQLKGAP